MLILNKVGADLKVAISGGFEQVLAQNRPFLIIFTVSIFSKFKVLMP